MKHEVINETIVNNMTRSTLTATLNSFLNPIGFTCSAWMSFNHWQLASLTWNSSICYPLYLNASENQNLKEPTSVCLADTNMQHCVTELRISGNDISIDKSLKKLIHENECICFTECTSQNTKCGIHYRPVSSKFVSETTQLSTTSSTFFFTMALIVMMMEVAVALVLCLYCNSFRKV